MGCTIHFFTVHTPQKQSILCIHRYGCCTGISIHEPACPPPTSPWEFIAAATTTAKRPVHIHALDVNVS